MCPHKDLVGCTSMSLNSSGSLALLAGRRCYAVVSLANPDQLAHRESRQSKWEVAVSEWAATDDRLLAVAANNKVELLSWTGTELVLDTSLRAHTRAVTDLSWHTFDSQILATSAADTFIYLWDMRDLRRPKQSLSAVAGAGRIQWNKVSGKYLASAHEGEVKLWDVRNPSSPVQYINAHLSRIYDIDWSHEQEDSLATSSQDSTVQFWNLASPTKSENMIKLPGSPVWKLQHTPVGSGLLTLAMQTVLRGQNNLMLWNIPDLRSPVHTFYAHDMVLDFGWFSSPHHNSRSQLVTWSRDCTLRIWEMDSEVQRKCGLETELDMKEDCVDEAEVQPEAESFCFKLDKDETETERKDHANVGLMVEEDGKVIINSPASLQMKKDMLEEIQKSESYIDRVKTGKSMNLNYEFSLINVSEKLNVVAQDSQERLFTVSAETDKNVLILHVKFPQNYPNQKAPIFSFLQGTTVDNTTRNNILVKLRNVAKHQISKNRRCLESCLRQFESCLDQLSLTEEEQVKLNNPGQLLTNSEDFDNREDEKIPYPRSSGARFCGDGNLVCFGSSRSYSVPVAMTRVADTQQIRTPRALSSMGSLTTPVSILTSAGATSPKYSVVGLGLCTSPAQDNGFLTYQARVPRVRFSGGKTRFSVTSVQTEDGGNERKVSAKSSVSGRPVKGTVTVYSCSGLMPYSKELAPLYRLPSTPGTRQLEEVCVYNAGMARQAERHDLADIWSLLALSASGCSLKTRSMAAPWAMNPFGGRMVEDMVRHFVQIRDVQTAAVISAVFGNRCEDRGLGRVTRKKNSKSETLRTDSKETLLTLKKYSRTVSENIEENHHSIKINPPASMTITDEEDDSSRATDHAKMIRPANNSLYDSYILAYADLLYGWNMFRSRTELLKCLSTADQSGLYAAKMTSSCSGCGQGVSGPRCVLCHAPSIRCSLCRLPCPGSTIVCPRCSHGGHPAHIKSWFTDHDECATGCGCHCLKV